MTTAFDAIPEPGKILENVVKKNVLEEYLQRAGVGSAQGTGPVLPFIPYPKELSFWQANEDARKARDALRAQNLEEKP